MNRKRATLLAALAFMATLAAFAQPKPAANLLLLQWAGKSTMPPPPAAILIEMGLKDGKPSPWSGRVGVSGAKVVHREGFRFRPEHDKLTDPDGWQASSHPQLRIPKGNPALSALEGMATVGVVLHLSDVKPDAQLTVHVKEQELDGVAVSLADVLAGKTKYLAGGNLTVRRVSATTALTATKAENDFPAAAYGPDGTLWVAYIAYHLKEEKRRIEAEQISAQPENFKSYYTPEFGDQLFVKCYRGGKWSEPIAVTDDKQDLMRCAIAVEGDGTPWVIYSANRDGKFDLYARAIIQDKPGPEQSFTTRDGPNLCPMACTDQTGSIRVAFRQLDAEKASVGLFNCTNGKWTTPDFFMGAGSGAWQAAITAGPSGEVIKGFDCYVNGDYDVRIHDWNGGTSVGIRDFGSKDIASWGDQKAIGSVPVAASARYEARPSLAYDPKGRLWIAYEEGPERWGKDWGPLAAKKGHPLYDARQIRVVCVENGKLLEPTAELPASTGEAPKFPYPIVQVDKSTVTSAPGYERLPRYSYPKIGIDGKGRVWVTYRQKFGSRYSTHCGSYWVTFARRLDGDKWSEPIELCHSDGLLDDRPALLPHPAGGLLVMHTGDGRCTTPDTIGHQIYQSHVDLPGEPVEPKLQPRAPGKKDEASLALAKAEAEAVKRFREYRIQADGKGYQPLRGEFHRHTEISWDGGPDGSLEDMWRYAVDAAALDWIGNTDHDSGAGREYTWWLIQKTTDAYHVKNRFTPMFSYERSVAYPNGHRNCVFAKRGVRTLPRLAEPNVKDRVGGVHADDTKMLYKYLHELDGICASHTSATGMGTDWRDNDPAVEPIVEIYQGDRMSYEMEGAPRAGYDPKLNKFPPNIAGWYPKGFINLALQKGYKLGFQSSSDHWSTHISFCIVLAERHDRAAILDAMKKRHCYGATDDIILSVKSGEHIMGDEFTSMMPPSLEIHAVGTSKLAKVEILKDGDIVHTFEPGVAELKEKWTDPKPMPGVHYYYVRVQQADGELAWGSPMWIDFAK